MGIGGQVTILIINLISGLAVGGTIMIAQFIGAERQQEVERTVGTMFTLYAIAGAAITVIMLLINPWVLRLMQTPADCYGEALAYLNICMGGTLFIVGYNAVSAVLRGMATPAIPSSSSAWPPWSTSCWIWCLSACSTWARPAPPGPPSPPRP